MKKRKTTKSKSLATLEKEIKKELGNEVGEIVLAAMKLPTQPDAMAKLIAERIKKEGRI